jgi:hypothetical protein
MLGPTPAQLRTPAHSRLLPPFGREAEPRITPLAASFNDVYWRVSLDHIGGGHRIDERVRAAARCRLRIVMS